ncbi:hypothetical protein MTR67_034915 [Solanum verrucosum]|uniref:Uncharacterized protein n=1 Tax=Solanum verrucosum TaxID=315347 RepID=A0AAF0U8X5_SOLVR|nr:hypothetical protein MTR67_034915 [Solanum verrucosum]
MFREHIREFQFDDEKLCLIRDKVMKKEDKDVLDSEGVLRIRGQQIKCEKQRPGGISKRMPTLTLKWEQITMDFVVGLCITVGDYDSVWVAVDTLTKSTHFIPVRMKYLIKKLAKLYINQAVRLHGVLISIISD